MSKEEERYLSLDVTLDISDLQCDNCCIYFGLDSRRTNIRKRLTVDLDCPTAVYLKAPLASLRAPI